MKFQCFFRQEKISFDTQHAIEISQMNHFDAKQPNAFSIPFATQHALENEYFIGDTRRGGSANCSILTLTPHGNGTHTECRGHLLQARESVADVVSNLFSFCLLLTVPSAKAKTSQEKYASPEKHPEDDWITACALEKASALFSWDEIETVVLRTQNSSLSSSFSGNNPAYLTEDAIRWLLAKKIQHLCIDLPSIDREIDGGLLPNHHLFWDVSEDNLQTTPQSRKKTITEMIQVPENTKDGLYLLNLSVPPMFSDALPSRVLLYPIETNQGESR